MKLSTISSSGRSNRFAVPYLKRSAPSFRKIANGGRMISHHQKLTAIRTTTGGTDNRNSSHEHRAKGRPAGGRPQVGPDEVNSFHREVRGTRSAPGAYCFDGLASLW